MLITPRAFREQVKKHGGEDAGPGADASAAIQHLLGHGVAAWLTAQRPHPRIHPTGESPEFQVCTPMDQISIKTPNPECRLSRVSGLCNHGNKYLKRHQTLNVVCPEFQVCTTMDQISIKIPNPKSRLYWCFIEFTDWRYS